MSTSTPCVPRWQPRRQWLEIEDLAQRKQRFTTEVRRYAMERRGDLRVPNPPCPVCDDPEPVEANEMAFELASWPQWHCDACGVDFDAL